MKNHEFFRKFEQLAVGKGFYIVLALCLTAAGVSGYYLFNAVTAPMEPAATQVPVTVPEREVTSVPERQPLRPVQKPVTVTIPDEEPAAPTAEPEPIPDVPVSTPKPAVPTVFTWPVKGEVLRDFSVETLSPDPTMGDWRTHAGLDISANLGERVLCMTEGTVADIWEDEKLGTCIRVEHGGKLESVYANLSPQPTVKVGDPMGIGAILGAVGTTANAESGMAPHLHLEVFREGESIDPMELLPEK